jgi:GT2 family glycosyltransferase
MTDLSIIIVSYKGWARLKRCLDALDGFTGSTVNTEVIIVDNNSGDNIIFDLEARYRKFRFIHNSTNGGFANGCNLGASNASGEYYLFLNPDTIASEAEVEKLLFYAQKINDAGIISCRQVNEKGKESVATGEFPSMCNLTGFQRTLLKVFKKKEERSDDIIFPDWVSGSVMLLKNDVFKEVKGFDEDYWMYYEDVDLCRRIRNTGRQIAFCRDVVIEHNHGGSSRINLKTAALTKTEVHISRHVYISRHKKEPVRFLIQAFLLINNLVSSLLIAIVGVILFFLPKLFLRTLIFGRLVKYYSGALFRSSWISPRSVNF